ncbi:UNVERIFIED_CONTAM: hypothetical protein Q9R58_11080 [Methylobacteriaceae bacterium AG10]|nr:hypothetical protein [Methylobacteriaceae bacterium AG10]
MPTLLSASVIAGCALLAAVLGANLWALRVAAAMTEADENEWTGG